MFRICVIFTLCFALCSAGISARSQRRYIGGRGGLLGIQTCNSDPWTAYPTIPTSFDARTQWPSCISPIRNQAICGSCWAFATTQTLTDRFCIASNGNIKRLLSPQNSVNCDHTCQVNVGPLTQNCNDGCDGGYLDTPWDYFRNTGSVADSCLGYSGTESACSSTCGSGVPYANTTRFHSTQCYKLSSVQSMQAEIMTYGPITVGFKVYHDFEDYTGGVYVYDGSSALVGGHAVRLIGWGRDTATGVDYWLCANQWTVDWGEDGLFRIQRGTNEAEIESNAVAGRAVTAGVPPQVEPYPPPASLAETGGAGAARGTPGVVVVGIAAVVLLWAQAWHV